MNDSDLVPACALGEANTIPSAITDRSVEAVSIIRVLLSIGGRLLPSWFRVCQFVAKSVYIMRGVGQQI